MSTDVARVISYGYNQRIIIEPTHGSVDLEWRAVQLDGSGWGYGNSHQEACEALVKNMRREADEIEKAIAITFVPEPKAVAPQDGW